VIQTPTDPKIEAAAALLKGAVSAIPVVGGVLAEVGDLYLNPLEKRKQRWIAEVSLAVEEIKKRFSVLPESLQSDERFISFLYQATMLALKNHQREKINALRIALVSVIEPQRFSEDLAFQFLRYIDELTVTHLSMLACLNKHAGQFSRLEKLEQVYSKLQSFLGVSFERAAFRSFLHDLDARFLIRVGDLEDFPEYASKQGYIVESSSTRRALEVTPLGRSFLSFVRHDES
jgi:hypothetical protein